MLCRWHCFHQLRPDVCFLFGNTEQVDVGSESDAEEATDDDSDHEAGAGGSGSAWGVTDKRKTDDVDVGSISVDILQAFLDLLKGAGYEFRRAGGGSTSNVERRVRGVPEKVGGRSKRYYLGEARIRATLSQLYIHLLVTRTCYACGVSAGRYGVGVAMGSLRYACYLRGSRRGQKHSGMPAPVLPGSGDGDEGLDAADAAAAVDIPHDLFDLPGAGAGAASVTIDRDGGGEELSEEEPDPAVGTDTLNAQVTGALDDETVSLQARHLQAPCRTRGKHKALPLQKRRKKRVRTVFVRDSNYRTMGSGCAAAMHVSTYVTRDIDDKYRYLIEVVIPRRCVHNHSTGAGADRAPMRSLPVVTSALFAQEVSTLVCRLTESID